MYMPFYGSHDTSLKIRSQISWDPYIKGEVWAQIVRAKIKGQARVLKDNAKRQASLLDFYIEQIEHDDATNREGFAAKVYFNALFGRDFSRSEGGFINSALNYGYMVMLSAVSRAVVSNGYATQIGIHHDNVYNEFNLSCDLVEPLRPFVDAAVLELEEGVELTKEDKLKLVDVLNRRVKISERSQYLINAMNIYIKSVFDALLLEDVSLIKWVEYEL